MQWLVNLDTALFHWINTRLANPVLDFLMPIASGNAFFMPTLVIALLLLAWRGRVRGIVCLLMLLLVLAVGDGFIVSTLKKAIGRARPAATLSSPRLEGKVSRNPSMPSSHAANWFSAAMVLFVYYRRSIWIMLPLACIVAFSRVYNGDHYPSDVLVGAILGAGYAVAILTAANAFWQWIGRRWFPLWWERFPSLLVPVVHPEPSETDEEPVYAPRQREAAAAAAPRHELAEKQWLRLGYVLIALLLFARLAYIAGDTIDLSEDEAYQWVWSKHLALSYFSKPPLIAYTQFLGTTLWGDSAFGVRFFSPVISTILGLALLHFFARELNARAGVFLLIALSATPLIAAGAVLMTIDPLSVLFWTAAMLSGWRAAQLNGTTRDWLWVGFWMALGFLSKYTQLFQLLSWVVFFVLWKPARKHLARPGPWLALGINLLGTLPVIIWNAQHHWVTLTHLSDRAGVDKAWRPTLRFFGEFVGAEVALLNPVFFVAIIWAAIAFWKKGRHNPKLVYFFSMGAPLFVIYWLFSFRSRVLPNWIAPAVIPLYCLMIAYWEPQWRLGRGAIRAWFQAAVLGGALAVVLAHDTDLVSKLFKVSLPVEYDHLRRVRKWKETANTVSQLRQELLAEGKPVFIIADHYGMTGELSFYLPEAREQVQGEPLVFYQTSPHPRNQFWFWPGYTNRTGQNAIFVREVDRQKTESKPAPPSIQNEFESVTDLGFKDVRYGGKVGRRLQAFACRGLR